MGMRTHCNFLPVEFRQLPCCPRAYPYSCSFFRENRYLLILTENYAALEILRHNLGDVFGCSSSIASATPMDVHKERITQAENVDPFILFGSSFPKDMEYTQVWTV